MSNRDAILTCYSYFLGCPQLRLTRARKVKDIESDSAASFIKDVFARDARV